MDEILIQGHHNWLRPLLMAMVLTAVLRLAAAALQQLYLTRLEVKLTLEESLKFLGHVLRLPLTFFQRRYTGDLVGASFEHGAGGRADFGRAGDDGRQPADPGRLRGRDAALRPAAGDGRGRDQQLESGCAQDGSAAGGPIRTGESSRSAAGSWRGSWGRSRSSRASRRRDPSRRCWCAGPATSRG